MPKTPVAVTKVSKKGLTTVPSDVRRALGVEVGDRLVWEIREEAGEKMAQVKQVPNPYRRLKGRYRDARWTYTKVEGLADSLVTKEAAR